MSDDQTGNAAALTFRKITAHDGTWLGQRARVVVGLMTTVRDGDRVVVKQWHDAAIGQDVEHPAGTITYARITGVGYEVSYIEPERVVTREELPPEIQDRL